MLIRRTTYYRKPDIKDAEKWLEISTSQRLSLIRR